MGVFLGFVFIGEDVGVKKWFLISIFLFFNILVGGFVGEYGLDVGGIVGYDKFVVGNWDYIGVYIFVYFLVDGFDDVLGIFVGFGGFDIFNKLVEF